MSNTARSFNSRRPGAVTVEIGWEHEVVDGEVVLRTDDAGEPIARTYTVAPLPPRLALERAGEVTGEMAAAAAERGLLGFVDLVEVFAPGLVMPVASDPTVDAADFLSYLEWLVGVLGLDRLYGAEADADPFGPGEPSAPSAS